MHRFPRQELLFKHELALSLRFVAEWMRAGGRRSPTGFEVIFSPGARLESDTAIHWGGHNNKVGKKQSAPKSRRELVDTRFGHISRIWPHLRTQAAPSPLAMRHAGRRTASRVPGGHPGCFSRGRAAAWETLDTHQGEHPHI